MKKINDTKIEHLEKVQSPPSPEKIPLKTDPCSLIEINLWRIPVCGAV